MMKTPTDRLSRAIKSRARLRQWSADTFAASFIGGGTGVSAPAKTRVLKLFNCSCTQALRVRCSSIQQWLRLHARTAPHPPNGGFGRACEHNARIIMRTRSCRSAVALLFERGCPAHRPHNVRYVRCTRSERRRSLKSAAKRRSVDPPPTRSSVVRSRETVARCLQHRFAPAVPKGLPVLVASLTWLRRGSLARSARREERRSLSAV